MRLDPPINAFWSRFAATCRADPTPRLFEVMRFGDSDALADELLALVLAGAKRATAGLGWAYDDEPAPKPGDLSIVTASGGAPRCVIETIAVERMPFDQVPAAFAAAEGEGDGSLDFWRRAHWAFFGRECAALGRSPAPDMPVLCERFEVVFQAEPDGTQRLLAPRSGHGALLRRLSRSDLAAFQGYRHDPETARFQGWTPMSDDEALAFLDAVQRDPLLEPGQWSQLALCEAGHAALAGDIGLHLSDDGREVEVGFTLAPASRGKGLATAGVRLAIEWLFANLPIERVKAVTDARNRPSIGVLQRLGMQRVASEATSFRGEACVEDTFELRRP